MKELKEYELTQESEDQLFGFTISCFVKNGIVWNEYYISYSDLPLNMINDLFYQDDDMAVQTYINLPVAYLNEDQDIDTLMNTYIMYSPKYDFQSITYPNFTCNINEHMEVEAIHSIDENGYPIEIDIRIDHKHNVIYVTNINDMNKQVILYFDKSGRIIRSDLVINCMLVSIDKFTYDDKNHEILESVTESEEPIYSVKTKTDESGRKLYMICYDENEDIINMITRRINLNDEAYIELCKFRIYNDYLDDIDFDD